MLRNSHADGDSHAGLSEPSWPIRALRRRSLFATKRRWRKTVSVLDLEKVAHEGDIVLFAGTGGGDSCLSCILGHEYTHCAIVVRGCPTEGSTEQQLCIMESVIQGVGLVPLQYFMKCSRWSRIKERFTKVTLRRLYVNGQPLRGEQLQKLRRFQAEMLGRDYAHPTTLVKAFVGMSGLFDETEEEDMSRLFCSQLVAGGLKEVGLLPPARPAASYLPPDFASGGYARWWRKRKLPLTRGAVLTKEIRIDFSEDTEPWLGQVDTIDQFLTKLYAVHVVQKWVRKLKAKRERTRQSAPEAAPTDAPAASAPGAAPGPVPAPAPAPAKRELALEAVRVDVERIG